MKIGVLLSGGVDSTVAAYLLKEQGYKVLAITMINGKHNPLKAARQAAAEVGIAHHVIDLSNLFLEKVIDYFCRTYAQGETPNPCTVCNRYIKFGALMEYAKTLGCEKIATGHYANVEYEPAGKRYRLKKGADQKKDQSYFLYGLSQEQLTHTIFPLGTLTKEEVRSIARRQGFWSRLQGESQEVCFIPDDYRDFLKEIIPSRSGNIVDRNGNRLGEHQGVAWFTIGQRKGLGVSFRHPLYVVDLDPERNLVVVGEEADLYSRVLWAEDNNFIAFPQLTSIIPVKARIRYRAQESPAILIPRGDMVRVEFSEPQRAVTKGQAVVYYDGDLVVGGGRIKKIQTADEELF